MICPAGLIFFDWLDLIYLIDLTSQWDSPNFFTVQKKSKKITVAKDPFSTDRELGVPKGGSFQLKKSTKKATQFVEFKKGDRDWKAPKQFEVKLEEKKAVKFWTGSSGQSQGKSRKGQRKAGDDEDSDVTGKKKSQKVSTDSELGSGTSGKRHLEQDMSQADKDVSSE
ncbi:hypothetical protein Btru_010539 [Bulinus truncatus]|nr:hypothetical protein Btru_010539 [Bulinus truncatus]